ncbi:hypothetical protein MN608_08483 [Microdochium nivale]|nr:hypothetical protein MN608_08483 [Microdochium nivale]
MGFLDDKVRAYKDARDGRSAKFSDEDIEKYTGKTRAELDNWAANTEGVGRWQKASSMLAGGTVGMGMGEMPTHVVGGAGDGSSGSKSTLKFGPEWEKREIEWKEHREREEREEREKLERTGKAVEKK